MGFTNTKNTNLWCDKYFTYTKEIVKAYGDKQVTYCIFMRRPIYLALEPAIQWLQKISEEHDFKVTIEKCFDEGDWVGAGQPLVYISGSFYHLAELETELLQKIGATSVAAYNARLMIETLPNTKFIAMDARHCSGRDMQEMMAYAASMSSKVAKSANNKIKGFVANANDATAHYYGNKQGVGTMPHAFIGYAGSTLEAAKMFSKIHPSENLTVLIDYFSQEIDDSLALCHYFKEKAQSGQLMLRIDTHSGQYIQNLNKIKSYEILEKYCPEEIKQYRTEEDLHHLVGMGVSAAAIFYLREQLDNAGFNKVKIVASSGFNLKKCQLMSELNAPIDVIGTGSFLPEQWDETYATADIVKYDDKYQVKVGREFLISKLQECT